MVVVVVVAPLGSSGLGGGQRRERTGEGGALEREKEIQISLQDLQEKKNEEAELLPIVQYSPSLHNDVE